MTYGYGLRLVSETAVTRTSKPTLSSPSPSKKKKKHQPMELGIYSMLIIFLSVLSLLQPLNSKTIVVDEAGPWTNPSVHIGDSLTFKYENGYNLYIFHDRKAYNLCNFSQAMLLSKPNSTSFAWRPSRSGFFYFSYNFNNGSLKACKEGEKLAIKVAQPPATDKWALSPELSPEASPSPISGGIVPSTPAFRWPFRRRKHQASSPSPAPSAIPPHKIPSIVPDTGGGIPFINSNPAMPLPTGQAASASIHPLPTSAHGKGKVHVVGLLAVQISLWCLVWVTL
ncbi:hypothetical protein NE237_018214 [Protea cynaroides]|uniref:Early nodulin-like protein 2 n=1 Tax=Protea cynaroides TaxID=273540 RepID=A0A9Q0K9I3_9MAGN|nr:hypothetical protein NE237_018214 [Protea cynaroides]